MTKTLIADSDRARIIEAAKEILDARTSAEFAEACRAMAAVLEQADVKP